MASPSQPREIALVFLRLGTIAFGGPATIIAMMQDETVVKRHWLDAGEFGDLLGAVNLLPGPASTKMAIFVGYWRAGWMGALLAGVCTTLPATLMMLPLAWAYTRYGALPQTSAIFSGMRPVIVVVVLDAIWNLGRGSLRSVWLAVLAFAACVWGVNPLLVIAACALVSVAWHFRPSALAALEPVSLWMMFLVFLKTGAVVFGSGYVLLAFFREDLVSRLHWLSEGQLLDAIAAGQITPGPTFASATFIGYLLGGLPGSAVATAAVFLPSFVLAGVSGPLVAKMRGSPWVGALLDGLNAGALALMGAVCVQLARSAVDGWFGIALMAIAAILVVWRRVNPAWIMLLGALAGLWRG